MKNFLIFAGDGERGRNRRALIVFLVGMVFVIWAWLNLVVRVMYRASEVPIESVAHEAEVDPDAPPPDLPPTREEGRLFARAAAPLLVVGLLLVIVFLVGTYVLVRSSRRFLESTRRERAAPSNTDDVWATHKVPDYDDHDYDEGIEEADGR